MKNVLDVQAIKNDAHFKREVNHRLDKLMNELFEEYHMACYEQLRYALQETINNMKLEV